MCAGSFGDTFADYSRHNVVATQRLLEQAAAAPELDRFVYASSSSVYGAAAALPDRRDRGAPSRLALRHDEGRDGGARGRLSPPSGVPVTGLRYFTAYGPRQRPDMAFNRVHPHARSRGADSRSTGTAASVRDFTFVDDVVDGTLAAAARGRPGRDLQHRRRTADRAGRVIAIIGEQLGGPLT